MMGMPQKNLCGSSPLAQSWELGIFACGILVLRPLNYKIASETPGTSRRSLDTGVLDDETHSNGVDRLNWPPSCKKNQGLKERFSSSRYPEETAFPTWKAPS
jgi:hypothetical protein